MAFKTKEQGIKDFRLDLAEGTFIHGPKDVSVITRGLKFATNNKASQQYIEGYIEEARSKGMCAVAVEVE